MKEFHLEFTADITLQKATPWLMATLIMIVIIKRHSEHCSFRYQVPSDRDVKSKVGIEKRCFHRLKTPLRTQNHILWFPEYEEFAEFKGLIYILEDDDDFLVCALLTSFKVNAWGRSEPHAASYYIS